jgi:hypothetical protein
MGLIKEMNVQFFRRFNRDRTGAALITLLSAAVIAQGRGYRMGQLTHMGAGFMPVVYGVLLVLVGLMLAATARRGPMLEENFRRALLISRGDLSVFIQRPISAWFIGACALLVTFQLVAYVRRLRLPAAARVTATTAVAGAQ